MQLFIAANVCISAIGKIIFTKLRSQLEYGTCKLKHMMGLVLFELKFSLFSLHFQSYLLKNVFTIPEDVILPEDRVQMTHPLSPEEDRQLDTEMDQLRKHIIAVSIHLFSLVATFCYDLYMAYCIAVVLTMGFICFLVIFAYR